MTRRSPRTPDGASSAGRLVPVGFDPWAPGPTPAQWAPWVAALPSWQAPEPHGRRDSAPCSVGRVVVVSPHPDDETLAHGGLVAHLAAAGWAVEIVGVTAGEGSHPGLAGLADRRQAEQRAAVGELAPAAVLTHLDLPDGAVSQHVDHLADILVPILLGASLVLTTWPGEPHPDHRAVAEACRRTAPDGTLWTAPVWAWHTERPGAPALLAHARRVDLEPWAVAAKRRAIGAYHSQMEAFSGPPIVPPHVRHHAESPWEVMVPCASR